MFFAFVTASHPKSSPSTAHCHLLVPVLTSIFTRLNGGLHCLLRILASAHTMSACLYHKNWLVVYLPLWKLWVKVSWDDDIPNIWKVIKHVPNHQAVWHIRSAYLLNAMNLRLIPWRKYGASMKQKLPSSVTPAVSMKNWFRWRVWDLRMWKYVKIMQSPNISYTLRLFNIAMENHHF